MGVSRPESGRHYCAFPSLIPASTSFVKKTIVFVAGEAQGLGALSSRLAEVLGGVLENRFPVLAFGLHAAV
jgi:hypothetical protein